MFAAESFESYGEPRDLSTADGRSRFYETIHDWFVSDSDSVAVVVDNRDEE